MNEVRSADAPPGRTPARRTATVVRVLLALLWGAATLRAFVLWAHDPLYAYANSYDQIRYTNCVGFYPDRPAAIPPTENSPQTPFSDYRFIEVADPMCYWSSELAFTGATALAWKSVEALGGPVVHDIRLVGALRWLALLALSIALSRAWLARGDARAALANAALAAVVFADPANTLYLDTFYAEWTALLAAYALLGSTLLWHDEAPSRRRIGWLAFAAFALATSKIQHLVLPLVLAAVVFALERVRHARWSWRGAALLAGAAAGLCLQFAQLHRPGAMMAAIDQYNRADVLFTAILPFADDRAALLAELGIDPACVRYTGLHAWEFPDLPERVCSGLSTFSRGTELRVFATHPTITARLAVHGVLALDPWIAKNLGEIEGLDFATIEPLPSLGPILHAWPPLQWLLLAAPFAGLAVLLATRRRRASRTLEWTVCTTVLMLATLGVTVLGDGLADTAKQGHLVLNAAFAWVCVVLVFGVTRLVRGAAAGQGVSSRS